MNSLLSNLEPDAALVVGLIAGLVLAWLLRALRGAWLLAMKQLDSLDEPIPPRDGTHRVQASASGAARAEEPEDVPLGEWLAQGRELHNSDRRAP